jgi:hypothetical protein
MGYDQTKPLFPIFWPWRDTDRMKRDVAALLKERINVLPVAVEFEIVERHAAQCQKNHMQSPQLLAERGGLAVDELAAVLGDRAWRPMPIQEAVRAVLNREVLRG